MNWNERYAAEKTVRMKARDIVQQFKPDMDSSTIKSLPKGHSLSDAWNFGDESTRVKSELLSRNGDGILDNIRCNNMHDPISVYRGDTSGYSGIKGMITDGHHRLTTALEVNPDCEFTVRNDPFYAAFEKAHKQTPCTGEADCPNCSNLEQPHY